MCDKQFDQEKLPDPLAYGAKGGFVTNGLSADNGPLKPLGVPTLRDRVRMELQHQYTQQASAMRAIKDLTALLQQLTPEAEATLAAIGMIDTLHRYNIPI